MASSSERVSILRGRRWGVLGICALLGACTRGGTLDTAPVLTPPPPLPVGTATSATRDAQASVLGVLPFADQQDFEDARQGFIATLDTPTIVDASGRPVWRLDAFDFLQGEAPETVNPSLWRQSQLTRMHGLYRVTDRIFQVRGFDLSVVSFVRGDTGWIVIDPLVSAETAAAALGLVRKNVADLPVVAVIHTHSHVDHFGGVRGVVDEALLRAGKVQILAPEDFLEHAVSENVLAGNVMSRRSTYMYGNLLPTNAAGQVGAGLGPTTSTGSTGLIPPTDTITRTGEQRTIDGVEIVFVNAPGSEAPAEMMFYFPQFRALCAAEDVTHTLHNLYTLRGAQVRDAHAWAGYIAEVQQMFGANTEVLFASHHWPRWGNDRIVAMLEKQHDLYKFIHDQTLRRANQGQTMIELAEQIELPESLSREFYDRGYYGTVNHDAKAVYQRYLGFFDGNPATLHPHPPVESSRHYVDFMGGTDELLRKARASFDEGDYRWVAEVVNHVVFAEPDNREARELQAAALEQLGFQAESGPWRNFYLSGAQELRQGVQEMPAPHTAAPDIIANMTPGMIFDFMAVHVDPERAADKRIALDIGLIDTDERYTLSLRNSTMSYATGPAEKADARIKLKRTALDEIVLGQKTVDQQVASGAIQIDGRPEAFSELLAVRDTFPFWFNIVTP